MKLFKRILLLAIAVIIGAALGYILLAGYNAIITFIFCIACWILGNVFYRIDKIVSTK